MKSLRNFVDFVVDAFITLGVVVAVYLVVDGIVR